MPRGRPGDADDRAELSCNSCRERKIRCNRVRPCCDKCKAIDVPCHYPARKQRSKRVLNTEDALKNIFERLHRLEITVANAISNGTLQHGADRGHSRSQSFCDENLTPSADETALLLRPEPPYSALTNPNRPQDNHAPTTPSLTQLISEATNLARAVLAVKAPESPGAVSEDAVLESLKRAETETADAEGNGISSQDRMSKFPPIKQLQQWMKDFFQHAPNYYFFSFRMAIPPDFFLQLPDPKDNPNIDPACLIIYYSLAHQGMALDEGNSPNFEAYSRGLYKACWDLLEPWKSKKSNFSRLDITAAISMTILAWKFLDNKLALGVLNHGCRVAEKLGLFHIDDPNYTHDPPLSEADKAIQRFLFWQLFIFDSGFSLQAGNPPAIKNDTWKVDKPVFSARLIAEFDLNSDHEILFLALSRLALAQRKINDLFVLSASIKTSPHPERQRAAVAVTLGALEREVQGINAETQLIHRYHTSKNRTQKWYYGDVLFNYYTTMTLLYRAGHHPTSVGASSSTETIFPMSALHSARQAINLIRDLHQTFPTAKQWNVGYVCFYPFIPFFTLFCNLLATDDLAAARSDLALTMWISDTIQDWSRSRASDGLARLKDVTHRLNGIGQYFIDLKADEAARRAQGEAVSGATLPPFVPGMSGMPGIPGLEGLNCEFDLENFFDSPVEYARVLETGVVTVDTHQEWWGVIS